MGPRGEGTPQRWLRDPWPEKGPEVTCSLNGKKGSGRRAPLEAARVFGVPGPKPQCKAGEPARSGSGLAVPLGSGAVSPLGPHGVEDGRGGRRPLWLNRAAGSQRLRPVWGRRAGARLEWTVSPVPLCFREKFVGSDLLCQQEQEEALGTGGGTFQGLPLAQSVRQELGRRQGEALASPGCTSGDSEHLCLSFPFSTVGEG